MICSGKRSVHGLAGLSCKGGVSLGDQRRGQVLLRSPRMQLQSSGVFPVAGHETSPDSLWLEHFLPDVHASA